MHHGQTTLEEFTASQLSVDRNVLASIIGSERFQLASGAFGSSAVPLGVAGNYCIEEIREVLGNCSDLQAMDAVHLYALMPHDGLPPAREFTSREVIRNFPGGPEQLMEKDAVRVTPPYHLMASIGSFGIGDRRRDLYRPAVRSLDEDAYILASLPYLRRSPLVQDRRFLASAYSWHIGGGVEFADIEVEFAGAEDAPIFPEVRGDPKSVGMQPKALRLLIGALSLEKPELMAALQQEYPNRFLKLAD